MFRWYVINTYSGHENKVRQNLLHRVESMSQQDKIRRVVVPTEKAVETKDGQKIDQYIPVKIKMTVTNEAALVPGMNVTVHIHKE